MKKPKENEAETCGCCGQTKPIALSRVHPDGTLEPLCKDCAAAFLESDENWPPDKTKKEHK